MSGLAVIFHRDGHPVDRADLQSMLDVIPYRGLDGSATWTVGATGLGHRLMVVTPEDRHDAQPLVSPRTGCAIVADVRLDNRAALLSELAAWPGRLASDADLILRAYEKWGLDALPRLLGDFAFAIWDPRQQRLVCARDTSGQRTLYYRADVASFVAASEIHQLFQDPAVAIEPSEDHLQEWLTPRRLFRNEQQSATTFYAGIHALPAGHTLIVEHDRLTSRRFWELTPFDLRYRSDDEYAEHFHDLFFNVVESRLRTSGPLGALLSGGLDSTSVVCTAQHIFRAGRAVDHGFTSFSFLFDGLDCDERHLIESVHVDYPMASEFVTCGAFRGRLDMEPVGFREAPNAGVGEGRDAVFGAASQAGVRVLLSGDVADACIGGGRHIFDTLIQDGDLTSLIRHLRAYRRVSEESWPAIAKQHILLPLLPIGLQRRVRAAQLRRDFDRHSHRLLPTWMPEPLRRQLADRQLDLMLTAQRDRRLGNAVRQAEYDLLYPPAVARHPAPWPVELWRPFADRRLHEFLLAIPPAQKFDPHPDTDEFYAGSKRILRTAMYGVVPEPIRTRRSKTYFGSALTAELKSQWPVFAAAFGPGARSELAARGLIEPGPFWERLQQARAGMDGADLIYAMQLVGLETWLRGLTQPRQDLIAMRTPDTPTRTDRRRSGEPLQLAVLAAS